MKGYICQDMLYILKPGYSRLRMNYERIYARIYFIYINLDILG